MRRGPTFLLVLPAICAATWLASRALSAAPMTGERAAIPVVAPRREAPLDISFRTTDGSIALRNLTVQIGALEQRGDHLTPPGRAQLVDLLSARAQYTGSVADRERALAIAEALVAAQPNDPLLRLSQARARSGLHHFGAALADVDAAAALGAPAGAVAGVRASVLQGLGRYDEALALRTAAAASNPSTDTIGALATLYAERGELQAASAAFARARAVYRDVSPFTIAWLLFDEGLMWMHHGDPARARAQFVEAHRRLPGYVAASCHLAEVEAELGDVDGAVARLAPLAEGAEDPDPAAQLARILSDRGDATAADRWRAQAGQRYDDLVARHPDAFADHGAEFYLAAGADPQRALALAQHNLAVRQTAGAYRLLLAAADAADRPDVACTVRAGLVDTTTPALRAVATDARALCS